MMTYRFMANLNMHVTKRDFRKNTYREIIIK